MRKTDGIYVYPENSAIGKWDFREVRRIYSPHPDFDLGFHTFNMYKGIIVVDALGFRKPKLCHLLRKFWNAV